MESTEIIHDIQDIYDDYRVPPNIRKHMLRVAGVAGIITHQWQGGPLDRADIIAVCLIHDLGNIMKMDFDSEEDLQRLGKARNRRDFWKEAQEEVGEEYGEDAHEATMAMAEELRVSDRVKFILEQKELVNACDNKEEDDWEVKICGYSDLRVAPHGVVPMGERFREAKGRYQEGEADWFSNLGELKECCFDIERQLFELLPFNPSEIDDDEIEPYMESFT